ncbi:hypothetical protein G15_2021 [Enterococcus avium]|uniref:DUF1642 domain-containing protein n=1 Tax=Enterococcus malodoratus TaxID=71451 RepID=UPI0008D687F6|nr:DUF1642 domain-containing protein [Enterococcus malodoratus]BBM18356.1 hypothetical protein G15_2021 [Enterococcus avium]SEU02531.1 hypothetical protein SAMN04487821_1546 [Enterococcus malodoratus]
MNKQDKEKLTSHIERNQLMTEVSMFGRTAEIDVVPSDRLLDLIDELASPVKAKLAKHWNEDLGDCLWWNYPIEEPPYCGTPLDDDFPKYKTHFTELRIPDEVEEQLKYYVPLPFESWDEDAAELKTKLIYLGFDITSDETRLMASKKGWGDFKTKLDEETIKSIDERYWPFAVPVEKV